MSPEKLYRLNLLQYLCSDCIVNDFSGKRRYTQLIAAAVLQLVLISSTSSYRARNGICALSKEVF